MEATFMNQPVPSLDAMIAVVDPGEATRVAAAGAQPIETQLQAIDAVLFPVEQLPQATAEQITVLLMLVREKFGLLVNVYSKTVGVTDGLAALVAAKASLDAYHLQTQIQTEAAQRQVDYKGGQYDFATEICRDVAQYLSKLGQLTGQPEYYQLAAQLLREANERKVSAAAPKTTAMALAEFEELVYLDKANQLVDSKAIEAKYRALIEMIDVSNWDRRAAVSWWLFEFGLKHANVGLINLGMKELGAALKSTEEKSWSQYVITRLGANAAAIRRKSQFKSQIKTLPKELVIQTDESI
jgi:hypothetical protein